MPFPHLLDLLPTHTHRRAGTPRQTRAARSRPRPSTQARTAPRTTTPPSSLTARSSLPRLATTTRWARQVLLRGQGTKLVDCARLASASVGLWVGVCECVCVVGGVVVHASGTKQFTQACTDGAPFAFNDRISSSFRSHCILSPLCSLLFVFASRSLFRSQQDMLNCVDQMKYAPLPRYSASAVAE